MVSVVLPAYNPPENWQKNLYSFSAKIKADFDIAVEFIVVNDGSKQKITLKNTNDIRVISYSENKGKGYALREGVKAATGELVIYTDIDFPYTHESFLKIYNCLKNDNADVAIGIRGEDYYTHLPKTRVRISKLLRWFIKIFLRIPTDDTQCGLKGFNQRGREIFLQTTIKRYLFDLEFIFLSAHKKISIKTIEVELRPEVTLSKMNWKILTQEFGNFLKIFVRSIF